MAMFSFQQMQKQKLSLTGGITDTIFPEVEEMLQSGTDYWEALEFVASRKDMERYYSVMDFLFCEIFTHYRNACFKYYDGKGPLLKDMIAEEQKEFFNEMLKKALRIALARFQEKRKASWENFQREVL